MTNKKPTRKKRVYKKKKVKKTINFRLILLLFSFIITFLIGYNWQNITSYYYAYFHDYNNTDYTFGIDVSHYQENINWNKIKESKHKIQFVFIRATMGSNRKDNKFKYNFKNASKNKIIKGAYHYYDPNENSTEQAQNFINSVTLKKGDFPPVLDIEEYSKYGNDNLIKGLKNWISIIENHYAVKPIIYSGLDFYNEVLKDDFKDYILWIAVYNHKKRIKNIDWTFHQFTDKVRVKGIKSFVDGNDFNGSLSELEKILIK